jgi:hypothetical protein
MVKFWLDDFKDLVSPENFELNDKNKVFNVVSLFIIIISLLVSLKTKNEFYFGAGFIILSILIIIHNKMQYFSENRYSSAFNGNNNIINNSTTITNNNNVILTEDSVPNDNKIMVNNTQNFYSGDIIEFVSGNNNNESNIVGSVNSVDNTIILRNYLKNTYLKGTPVNVIKSVRPQIISQSDPNMSIEQSKGFINPPPGKREYSYYSPKTDNLTCRYPMPNNPMGNIGIEEYDEMNKYYGSCNEDPKNNDTINHLYEAGVSQRINDVVYHRGNSQSRFTPMAVDTVPNAQDQFAMFCYQTPGNLVNPKYASVFVNDPEKFKLVASLAKATGTENGG